MIGYCRFRQLFGLFILLSLGMISPAAAVADTPAPSPPVSRGGVAPAPQGNTSTSYKLDPSQFSLLVSPTRLVVRQKDIGTTQRLMLVNRGQAPVTVSIEKRNFIAGQDGSLRYAATAPYSASNWVQLSDTKATIDPGGTKYINIAVKSPSTYEPGDHQVAVVFMVPAGKTSGNIKVNRGIATPVFITAPGPVTDSVSMSGLHAPRFVTGGDVNITATIHNNGTVHHDFRAPSALTVEVAGKDASFPDFTVPRNSIRDISTTWKTPFLCVCHATVTLDSANGGKQSETVRVIVFPWPWFAAALGALLLLLLGTRLARRRYQAQVRKAAAELNASRSGSDV